MSGRKLEIESKRPKWIHYGQKSKWIYPSFVNEKYIKQSGEVILVESIGDMLSLWEAGVKNTIVLFGVNLSKTILFYLIASTSAFASNTVSINQPVDGAKISGHICQGHVDTIGKVFSIKKIDKSYLFDLEIDKKVKKHLILQYSSVVI